MSKEKVIYQLEDYPLKKNEEGLYAILPYERLDKHKKELFKVGLAKSFDKRFESYHTDYPLGFYYKNLLASPTKEKKDFQSKCCRQRWCKTNTGRTRKGIEGDYQKVLPSH